MKLIKMSFAAAVAVSMATAGGNIAPVQEVEAAAPVVEEKVDYGTFFGQSRTFYIDRTITTATTENNRNSLTTGGYIGYTTPNFSGLTATVAAYGLYGFDIHDADADVVGSSSYDPSVYGTGFENYAYIGQLYLNYAFGNTNIKVGRQRLDTPLAGSDDARVLPNLFEAAVITNTDIANTTLIAAHVTKESVGDFGNVYGVGTSDTGVINQLALQSGYGAGFHLGDNGDFMDMGEVALGAGTDTNGVTALAGIYKGIEGVTLQAWDYIAWDILNAVYLQADFGWNCKLNDAVKMTGSLQYIGQSEIGDELAGKVDSNYFGAKLGAAYGNLSGYLAYSTTGSNDDTLTNGGIISPWGGMPAFTQGMVTRHQFFADTDAMKVAAAYNFADLGVKASAYYVEFDVGTANTYKAGTAWTAKESGFDIQYNVPQVKGLNLRLRANFPTDFAPGLDWDEYRVIANYNF